MNRLIAACLALVAGGTLIVEGVIPAPRGSRDLAAILLGVALILVYQALRGNRGRLAFAPVALVLGVLTALRSSFEPSFPLWLRITVVALGGAVGGVSLTSLVMEFSSKRGATRGPKARKTRRSAPRTQL